MALSKNSKIEVADINAISSTASSALSTANTANTNATNAYNLANSKQNNLGFTPIQQGGGAYQGTNKVYIGWDGSALRCQVDSTDLGQIFTSNVGKTTVNWADGAWSATVTPSVACAYNTQESGLICYNCSQSASSAILPSGGTWRYLTNGGRVGQIAGGNSILLNGTGGTGMIAIRVA